MDEMGQHTMDRRSTFVGIAVVLLIVFVTYMAMDLFTGSTETPAASTVTAAQQVEGEGDKSRADGPGLVTTAETSTPAPSTVPSPTTAPLPTPTVVPAESAADVAVKVVGLGDDWLYADADALDESLVSVFAPEELGRLRTLMMNEGVGLMRTALATAPSQDPTWFFTQALSVAVIEENPSEAHVQVWAVEIFSREQISAPTSTWTLHDLDLVQIDGRWLVSGWTTSPGPVPRTSLQDEPANAAQFHAELFEHTRVDRAAFEATTKAESR